MLGRVAAWVFVVSGFLEISAYSAFAEAPLQACYDHWHALEVSSSESRTVDEDSRQRAKLASSYARSASRAIRVAVRQQTGQPPAIDSALFVRLSKIVWPSVEDKIPAECRIMPGVGRFTDSASARQIRSQIEDARQRNEPRQAASLATILADGGDARSQSTLGEIYRDGGPGLEKDLERAVSWFMKAADQGDPVGLLQLGFLYVNGTGVSRDPSKGVSLIEKAAEEGLPEAQYVLSQAYQQGLGVAQDQERSIRWLVRAAEAGSPVAQASLAERYAVGKGVPRDLPTAAMWIQIAEREVRVSFTSGEWELRSQIRAMAQQIAALTTPEEFARAQARASECERQDYVSCSGS